MHRRLILSIVFLLPVLAAARNNPVKSFITIKQPGDPSIRYELGNTAPGMLPVTVTESCE